MRIPESILKIAFRALGFGAAYMGENMQSIYASIVDRGRDYTKRIHATSLGSGGETNSTIQRMGENPSGLRNLGT
jgi:hypothetical protein